MTIEIKIPSLPARERLNQLRALLAANAVPKPHIIWIQGRALLPLLASIGKEPYEKDGCVFHEQLYRFNLDTGRFRKVDPRPQEE